MQVPAGGGGACENRGDVSSRLPAGAHVQGIVSARTASAADRKYANMAVREASARTAADRKYASMAVRETNVRTAEDRKYASMAV